MPTPEAMARENIDGLLTAAGWVVQDRAEMNLAAGRGVDSESAGSESYQQKTII